MIQCTHRQKLKTCMYGNFPTGTHLNCYKQFDGLGGEIAHKFYRDVHFDKTDPYTASITTRRSAGISLLLVSLIILFGQCWLVSYYFASL